LVVSVFVLLRLGYSLLGTFVWISYRCNDVFWNGMYYGVYWMVAMAELRLLTFSKAVLALQRERVGGGGGEGVRGGENVA
jgi:uncharacterized protein (DUF983 family)